MSEYFSPGSSLLVPSSPMFPIDEPADREMMEEMGLGVPE